MPTKKMLIDAAHSEEVRVAVVDGIHIDDFDFETQSKRQLRGNIYLAKVTRVEPSLQAAFVEYGGNRHGFLAFGDIHPDYYQIPVADREALKAEIEAVGRNVSDPEPAATETGETDEADASAPEGEAEAGVEPEIEGDDGYDPDTEEDRRRRMLMRRYKIQEVIRRRQIMLVQVVKEERGNKGAALTTYLSLAGRYCVLMPNTGRGGGISRKITNMADRKRLKKIAAELEVPNGMGLIVRTAGAKRTKTEIKRDYEYLLRAWESIRELTLRSVAPACIYEESSLVKRAIRDLYDKDVDDIFVEGDAAYKEAKDFIRMLMPSHAKKVQHYRNPTPIFTANNIERHLESIYNPIVHLRSGGYLVINQTEALVAIDVNSGRATRERNIESTALKTNMEAADEAARQMRLRDLAGLIVIDFIDMDEPKNDRAVEKRLKDALRYDRARVQMGKISAFGLMELSRQRRRTGVLEGSSHICDVCAGAGRVRTVESSTLRLLRALDEECVRHTGEIVEARAPSAVALYLLNEKRAALSRIEDARDVQIRVNAATDLLAPDFELIATGEKRAGLPVAAHEFDAADALADEEELLDAEQELEEDDIEPDDTAKSTSATKHADGENEPAGAQQGDSRRRRRRGRRGGRRRREGEGEGLNTEGPEASATSENSTEGAPDDDLAEDAVASEGAAPGERTGRRRRRRRRSGRRPEGASENAASPLSDERGDAAPSTGYDDDEPEEESPALVALESFAPPSAVATPPQEEERIVAEITAATRAAPDAETAAAALDLPDPQPELDTEDDPAEQALATVGAAEIADYSPDQERREKFFARLGRWGKKPG